MKPNLSIFSDGVQVLILFCLCAVTNNVHELVRDSDNAADINCQFGQQHARSVEFIACNRTACHV
jgi:hypothetical protein